MPPVRCDYCGEGKNAKGAVTGYRDRFGVHDMHAVCYQNFLDERGR